MVFCVTPLDPFQNHAGMAPSQPAECLHHSKKPMPGEHAYELVVERSFLKLLTVGFDQRGDASGSSPSILNSK